MDPVITRLLLGIGLAVLISLAAWRARSLSITGALAATLLGTVIFGLGGLSWAILLLAFFISSSALSRMFKQHKTGLEEKFSKGAQRDAGQVLANGGIAGLFVLFHLALPAAIWPWLAFAGALAAANADTWATELGVLSRSAPRLVTNGQVVERGTSGGVTPTGTMSALGGSLLIAVLAISFWPGARPSLPAALAVFGSIGLAGLAGSLLDSYLGATVQAIYRCPCCQKETERHPIHSCGCQTSLARGWSWMDNDWVNGFCTLAGAALAALAAALLSPL
jgi:uncharacterized protein (TIGR00297 family)